MFIEILFKMLLFKGGVLIFAEHCIYYYCSCILSFVLYTVLCMLTIEPLNHVTLPIPCLVSMNSSSDDLMRVYVYTYATY